jgi:hypothetical protein
MAADDNEAHKPGVPHLNDEVRVRIDAAACQRLLDSGQRIDDESRLMLEAAIRHGDGTTTIGELKRAVRKELTRTRH